MGREGGREGRLGGFRVNTNTTRVPTADLALRATELLPLRSL